jgi:hypothetical protein
MHHVRVVSAWQAVVAEENDSSSNIARYIDTKVFLCATGQQHEDEAYCPHEPGLGEDGGIGEGQGLLREVWLNRLLEYIHYNIVDRPMVGGESILDQVHQLRDGHDHLALGATFTSALVSVCLDRGSCH